MNPALTPLSRIREMTNTELVAFAKDHSHLTILEREFLKRMADGIALRAPRPATDPTVQSIVDWAKEQENKRQNDAFRASIFGYRS